MAFAWQASTAPYPNTAKLLSFVKKSPEIVISVRELIILPRRKPKWLAEKDSMGEVIVIIQEVNTTLIKKAADTSANGLIFVKWI